MAGSLSAYAQQQAPRTQNYVERDHETGARLPITAAAPAFVLPHMTYGNPLSYGNIHVRNTQHTMRGYRDHDHDHHHHSLYLHQAHHGPSPGTVELQLLPHVVHEQALCGLAVA